MTDGYGFTNSGQLADRTTLMSGGSRGIGLAIATAAARLGANIVLLAKTDQPHPRLPGTVHTAKAGIEAAGGRAAAVVGDVREAADVDRAVATALDTFGGIDIVVNNASAIDLAPSDELALKKFDLMQSINVRCTWLLTTRARLWPETLIATAAVRNVVGGADRARSPQIMTDAAVAIFAMSPQQASGRCFLDTEVLTAAGGTDFARYGGSADPALDIYVDAPHATVQQEP